MPHEHEGREVQDRIMGIPFLEWTDDNRRQQRMEISDKIFIGRSCDGIDARKRIIVPNSLVSRDHATITWSQKGHLLITDMSKNGTWVNEVFLTSGSSYDLKDGDIIRIAECHFRVIFPMNSQAAKNGWSVESTVVSASDVVVTNLVADIRGFTGFSHSHTSSETYALVKEIFEEFSNVVTRFKGTVKDYAGDAVFSFWSHEIKLRREQAVLACQAALQQEKILDTILAGFAAKYQDVLNLGMGWGLTTGTATMSHYGSRLADMALVGDCVNLAFHFSATAARKPFKRILICAKTAQLVCDDFALKDLGLVQVKGSMRKERVFALT